MKSKMQMREDKLNVNLIKNLLTDEIHKYFENSKERRIIRDQIALSEQMIKAIEEKDYISLMKKIEEFYSVYESNDFISKTKCKDVYFGICFLTNSNVGKYSNFYFGKRDLVLKDINFFHDQLISYKNSKIEELEGLTPPISDQLLMEYKNVLFDFINQQNISSQGYETIKKLLMDKGYSNRDIVIFLEKVKIHNINIDLNKRGARFKADEAYRVIDVIKTGYEDLGNQNYAGKNINKLTSMIDACKLVFKDYNFENAQDLLPAFDGIDSFTLGYTRDEFEYVMKSLLIHYQSQLFSYYNTLINLENYDERELRNLIVDEYYKISNLYKNIRRYMDDELETYDSLFSEKEESKENKIFVEEYGNKKEVYYLLRNSEEISTFFENDLKDIPNDLYSGVKDLLLRFQNNTLSVPMSRQLNEAFPGLKEIKNDQVRIIYRHIEGNKYVIVGIFQKKRDLDKRSLESMYKRPINNIKHSSEVEIDLFKSMDEKMHHGGRKN